MEHLVGFPNTVRECSGPCTGWSRDGDCPRCSRIEERVLPFAEAMVAADTAVPSPAFVRRAVEDGEISTEPLTDLQESLVELARELDVAGEGPWLKSLVQARAVRTEHDGAEFVQERAQRFLSLPDHE